MRSAIATTLVVFALLIGIVGGEPLVAMADPLGEPPPADVVGDPAGNALGALFFLFAFPFLILWVLSGVGRSRGRKTNKRTVRQPEMRVTLRSRSLPQGVKFTVPMRHSRTIPQDVKIAVSVRDGGKCRVCGSTKDLQYDHIYPWSLGGRSDDPNNIQLLCGYHNRLKSNR